MKWLIRCCSDSNVAGSFEVTADLSFCPQRIVYLPLPQIMSQLLFLSVVDVFECSEEAADALQLSSHTSGADLIQPRPVRPTAYN